MSQLVVNDLTQIKPFSPAPAIENEFHKILCRHITKIQSRLSHTVLLPIRSVKCSMVHTSGTKKYGSGLICKSIEFVHVMARYYICIDRRRQIWMGPGRGCVDQTNLSPVNSYYHSFSRVWGLLAVTHSLWNGLANRISKRWLKAPWRKWSTNVLW